MKLASNGPDRPGLFILILALATIVLITVAGGVPALCIMGSLLVATWRRPVHSLSAICIVLPFFLNGPGRPLVFVLNGLLAIVIVQWWFEDHRAGNTDGRSLENRSRTMPVFFVVAILWLVFGCVGLIPFLITFSRIVTLSSLGQIIEECLTLGETSALFPLQALFNRIWAVTIVWFIWQRTIGKNELSMLLRALLVGLFISVSIGLLEYFAVFPLHFDFPTHGFGGLRRLQSFGANPGWLAQYICLLLPLPFALLFSSSSDRIGRPVLIVVIAWSLVALYYTYSRAGWLAFAAIVGVMGLAALITCLVRSSRKRYGVIVLLVTLLLAITIFLAWKPVSESYFFTKEQRFGTSFSRFNLWTISWQLFRENPLVGTGLGTFWHESGPLTEGLSYLNRVTHNTAHNIFFHVLAEEGLTGLVFLVVLCGISVAALIKGLRRSGPTALQLTHLGTLAVFLVFGIFQHLFYVHAVELLVWMLLAMPFLHAGENSGTISRNRRGEIACVVIIIMVAAVISSVQSGPTRRAECGFYKWESWGESHLAEFRWTKQHSRLSFSGLPRDKSILVIPFLAAHPHLDSDPLMVTINLPHKEHTFTLKSQAPDYLLLPIEGHDGTLTVRMTMNRGWSPAGTSNDDDRQLGLAIGHLYFLSTRDFVRASASDAVRMKTDTAKDPDVMVCRDGERLVFSAHKGLHYCWFDVKNDGEDSIEAIFHFPSGLTAARTFTPGMNRIPLKIPPSRRSVKITCSLTRKDGQHGMKESQKPEEQHPVLQFRQIRQTMVPGEKLAHFALIE